jgi:hypothetical protein
MLFVLLQGNDIQLVIPTGYKAVCDKVLLENTTYTLSNFQVQKNDDAFKASDHKYKLIWTGGTNADNVNVHDIPNPSIKFKPFSEIVSGKWRADLLVREYTSSYNFILFFILFLNFCTCIIIMFLSF